MLGAKVYEQIMRLESRLYGFSAHHHTSGTVHWHYLDNHNEGKPKLVLLHGFSASHTVWLRCARHLTRDFHILIPDLPGHGESNYDQVLNYSVPNQTARLHELLMHLQWHNTIIAGNSMGGFMAAQYALDFAHNTLGIVCIDPAGVTGPQPSKLEQTVHTGGRNPFFMDDITQFDSFYAMTMTKPPFMPRFILKALAAQYVERKSRLEHIFTNFYNKNEFLNDRLGDIRSPVLLLWGAKDELIDISCAPVWQQGTQGISVVWDDLGHMPMLEAPNLVAQEIKRFLP